MRRAALAVTAAAMLLLGACGIPDNSEVEVLHTGPTAGVANGQDDTPPTPATRDSTIDSTTFVDNYLLAAAGDPEGAVARAKDYLSPEAQATFKPQAAGIQVVSLADTPLITPGTGVVSLKLVLVGVLQDDGQLVPSSDPTQMHVTLKFGTLAGQSGLFITETPSILMITADALSSYYQQRTIYFWNTDQSGLVPDVRYMPRSVPQVQQPTVILGWLAGGPSDWLKNAVVPLPTGTTVPDNIPAATDAKIQISLNMSSAQQLDAPSLDRLRRQLQWSLRGLLPETLELKINRQNPVSYTNASFLDSNAAYRLRDKPERFVLYNGVIRRLSGTPQAVNQVPVLQPAANKGLQAAAISTSLSHTFAAVVTSGHTPALKVAVSADVPPGQEAPLKTVPGLPAGTLGTPVWAVTSAGATDSAIGLITVGGKLYTFGSDGSAAQPVEWQSNDPGAITSVSVAPDGRRVAVTAGGQLLRTVLTINGDAVGLAAPQQLRVSGLSEETAVAWSSEGWLVVAGMLASDERYTVLDVTADGSQTRARVTTDLGKDRITYLTAYPASPTGPRDDASTAVSYVAAGEAWDVLSTPVAINAGDLAGPAGSPPPNTKPMAPFFLN